MTRVIGCDRRCIPMAFTTADRLGIALTPPGCNLDFAVALRTRQVELMRRCRFRLPRGSSSTWHQPHHAALLAIGEDVNAAIRRLPDSAYALAQVVEKDFLCDDLIAVKD